MNQDHVGLFEDLRVRERVAVEARAALLFRALSDEDQPDPVCVLCVGGRVTAQRAQRGQVGEHIALAVGGTAAIEPAVALGQLERRAQPLVLVENRLHVVVAIEQHRRSARGGRAVPNDRVGAVRGELKLCRDTFGAKCLAHPLRGAAMHSRVDDAAVGD